MEDIRERLGDVTIIVPSLNPDEKLKGVVGGLLDAGFTDIIVINDGSAPEYLANFPEPSDKVTLLTHEVNRGKGAGMKTAFSYMLSREKKSLGAVAVDGDGQHKPEDVINCAAEMLRSIDESKPALVLGCRDFSQDDVPPRSRFGNRCTCLVFRLMFGMKISDTQTGLRAYPTELLPAMLEIKGDRYEYETNMLIALKPAGIPLREVKISTVYIDGNQTSHFRWFRDSVRIYGLIIKYMLSSLASWLVDIGVFTLLNAWILPDIKEEMLVSQVIARIVSSLVNFCINKKAVFDGKGSVTKQVLKYYAVAVPQCAVSYALIYFFSSIIPGPDIIDTPIKMVVDTVLFLLSFRFQREWVFNDKKRKDTD